MILNISQVTEKSIIEAKKWFASLKTKLDQTRLKNSSTYFKEINERLDFLF